MSTLKNTIVFCLLIFFVLIGIVSVTKADEPQDFQLDTDDDVIPRMGFDMAGYSDWWYWGPSPRHDPNYASHEILCGEWAAGLAYSVSGHTKFEWLTDKFSYPDWPTGTGFQQDSGSARDSISNPISGNDTAQSIIHDPNIRITIDYRLMDLGENGYVAIPFYPQGYSGSDVPYSQSERYILIQSYNITNTHPQQSGINITGLKFYQMINSLVVYPFSNTTKSSIYSNVNISGLLPRSYDPCNPGATNDFQFAITQWAAGDPNTQHVDWVSFASTIEPTSFGNGIYNISSGGDSTPGYITYDIKDCNLNNDPNIYDSYQAAGAMGWDLGALAPGQTKSITLAVMFGSGTVYYTPPIPPLPEGIEIDLTKDDNIDGCVILSTQTIESDVNYTITYSLFKTNPFDGNNIEVNDVKIVDFLPKSGVDFIDAEPNDYDYNDTDKTVTWYIGDVNTGSGFGVFDTLTLKVKVREDCPQGISLTNIAKFYSGGNLIKTASVDTSVCCLYDTVFVDIDANDGGDGKSWDTAYNDLQTALINVNAGIHGCADKIFVAAGTYYPTDANDPSPSGKTFTLIDGIDIYGHFEGGWESSIDERNLADTNNTTTLSGDINGSGSGDVSNVVTAANGRLDGFTVKKASSNGINGNACSPIIANCVVKDNGYSGIYMGDDTHAAIINTFVTNNNIGIYGSNNNASTTRIDINECTVSRNGSSGLICSNGCTVNAADCIFGRNGIGIYANSSVGSLFMQRCDVNDNTGKGISISGTNANIQRCRIQRNSGYGLESLYANASLVSNIISDNDSTGVYIFSNYSGNFNLMNNLIYRNSEGIYSGYDTSPEIYNNTIVYNDGNGINDYHSGGNGDPNINSNIIYDNTSQLYGTFNADKVKYNCIQDGHSGIGNINDDPLFNNADVDDYHLTIDSNCINAGDPNFTSSVEKDIDGEDRIINGRIEIGSDEFYDCIADFNGDGIVDFADLILYSNNWLDDVNASMPADFIDDNFIDFKDFAAFAKDWQWKAGWSDAEILLAEDFENGIPDGWTVVDDYNDNQTWTTGNLGGKSSSYWTGNFCIVDSDFAGYVDMNETIITSVIDCTGALEVTLNFSHYFENYSDEKCDVDVSVNNGSWQTVLQYAGASTGGKVIKDISALAANQPNVRIRWHYYDAYYDYYWGIDNVKIIGNYRIPQMQYVGGRGAYFEDTGGQMQMMMSESSLAQTTLPAEQAVVFEAVAAQAEPQIAEVEPVVVDVNEILDWLDNLWETDEEIRDAIAPNSWLEFIESIKSSE